MPADAPAAGSARSSDPYASGLGVVTAGVGAVGGPEGGPGVGLSAMAVGLRTASPSALAARAAAGLERRAGAWAGRVDGDAATGFVVPLAGGGLVARLGAGGGASWGPAGRVACVTLPSAEIGYQTIRSRAVSIDAGVRASSALAGTVAPAGSPAASLPPSLAAGAFATIVAPGPGLWFDGRASRWGAGATGPVASARASGCVVRGWWALCFDVAYERAGRAAAGRRADDGTYGLRVGLGARTGIADGAP
jgi:hypothetical protein